MVEPVETRRWIPDSELVVGFVVATGAEWVAVVPLGQWVQLDGWCLLRIADIQAVVIEPDPECFEVRAVKARGEWPPEAAPVDLDAVGALLASVSTLAPVVGLYRELEKPGSLWEGTILAVEADAVTMREVTPRASWKSKVRLFDLDDVTRVEFGGGYEETLLLVAGPPPPPS